MSVTSCRYFNGYKPCGRSTVCDQLCPSLSIPSLHILIISLEALGAVLRSTVILKAIKRKYPSSHITWITKNPAQQLLKNNPLVDRLLTTSLDDQLKLSALEFDIAYVIDKSLEASGLLRKTQAELIYGFIADPHSGAILPATSSAKELWELGLDNEKKFYKNQKPETQLLIEALELGSDLKEGYYCPLTEEEINLSNQRHKQWSFGYSNVIGINTGCSGTIPYKKFSVEYHRRLILELKRQSLGQIVLLGGPEDTLRNQQIAYGMDVIQTPTTQGLRDGLVSVNACDIVITGDSLGMHMAIANKKWTVVWFGPTCAQEIDLFNRGKKVITQSSCNPCWKRLCDRSPMCYDLVSVEEIISGVKEGILWKSSISSSKQHLSEI